MSRSQAKQKFEIEGSKITADHKGKITMSIFVALNPLKRLLVVTKVKHCVRSVLPLGNQHQ